MRFSQPKREEMSLGISIAPLIDIVFLLLIFFMVTSHFEVISGIDITLPDIGEKGSGPSANHTMIVALDKVGNCYLENEKVTLKNLYGSLKKNAEQSTTKLVLQADRDVKHGDVVRVMDLAKKAGVASIVIAAQWEPEKVF